MRRGMTPRLVAAVLQYAATFGGGTITSPGRHLVLLPPIHGATAASGTPYLTLSADLVDDEPRFTLALPVKL